MSSEKGITLTVLAIYIIVATIVISAMAILSSFFYSNVKLVKDQSSYVVEYNKFNMFFVRDVKANKTAQVINNKIIFEDGTTYEHKSNSIYRNEQKIAKQVKSAIFTLDTYTINKTTKNLINVKLNIGTQNKSYEKQIEYVLKYW